MGRLFEMGAHRLQIIALESRVGACHWYAKGLKMQREGVIRGYGRNGENAIMFGRLRDDP